MDLKRSWRFVKKGADWLIDNTGVDTSGWVMDDLVNGGFEVRRPKNR